MPFDIMFLLRQQRHREMLRQAEQAQLLQAGRRTLESHGRVFQRALQGVGSALLEAGRAMRADEKGCRICLQ